MAAEFDRIPVGAPVFIFSHTGKCIAKASLLEEFTVNINSEFSHVVDSGNSTITNAIDVFGGALKSLSNGKLSGSSQWKQMGASVWRKTDNFAMSLSMEFSYSFNAMQEVVKPVEALCELVLPGETSLGNLQVPGPSVLEALAPTFPNTTPPASGVPMDVNEKEEGCDKYVNIVIGRMQFLGWLIVRAEPTYSKYIDESGAPIYCRVAIEARSVHTATKDDMRSWMR